MSRLGGSQMRTVARDRLLCLLQGHDYFPVMDEPVEWCPRCGQVRPLAAPADPPKATVVRQALHFGTVALKLAGLALLALVKALDRAISWRIQHRRQASIEKRRDEPVDAAAEEPAEVAVAPDERPAPSLDRAALQNILHIEEAGAGDLIVDTVEGDRLRVSANKDPEAGVFRATYETLGVFTWRDRKILVWQPTSSYRIAAGTTVEECLDSALAEIEAGPRLPEQAELEEVPEAAEHSNGSADTRATRSIANPR